MRLRFRHLPKRVATSLLVAIALVSGALAYFTTTGAGNANGSVTTLSAPASPAASGSGTSATITWNASTIGGTVAATTYTVERYSSGGTDLGAASCSPVSSGSGTPNAFGSFTCADSPGGGSFKYKITAKYHSSWTATTAFTGTASVQSSTSTSASGPATDATNTAIAASAISSTLSGGIGATGTITFKVFGPQASAPSTCTSGGTTVGTATVSGNATYHPSAGYTPSSAGTYWWYASYGGDSGNTASASTCGSGMSSTVVKNAGTLTAAAPASGNAGSAIAAGSIGSTLSGATAGATGTITFTVFGPQATAPSTCTSGGTTVGTATVSGNATYTSSASFTPSTAGTYWWYASYSGDSNNSASSSTCGSGMTSTVVGKANAPITAGAPGTDTTSTAIGTSSISATLSGATTAATGTITFTVFGPQATAPTTCTSGGTTVGTASVSGNGTYNPSAGYTPSTAGTYWWYVSYGGDSNNSASNSTCGTGMTSTVVTNLTIATASGPATGVSGTAVSASSISSTLVGATSGATGTITFTVFGPQATAPTTCTSGGTTVGTATVSGNATYHPSAGFTPSSAGIYWWYVSYNGDTSNGASTSTCGSAMASTYVYSVSSAASATATTGTSANTSSFTVQPSTTYLLLVFRNSASGDGITSLSSTGLSPSLTLASFSSITSQSYSSSVDYQWAYWITTASNASGSGTLTLNFTKSLGPGGQTTVDLVQLGGVNPTAPVVASNEGLASGSSSTATANLPNAPSASDPGLVFVTSANHLGSSAPAATPGMTNVFFASGYAGVYTVTPASQNESFPISGPGGGAWGSIALEINSPAGLNGNTTTTTVSAPSTGSAASAISAGSISSTISGGAIPKGTVTFTVFGPQASAPTTCTSGGTTVGTATVSGNGTYNPNAGYTPSTPGTYWWYASYGGDAGDKSSASTCGSGMASTVVGNAAPSLTVSPLGADTSGTAILASSISSALSGAASGASGTITYTVFGPQAAAPTTCTSGGTTVGTSTVSGNGSYSSSAGFTPSSAGTYWWYASYGGDSNDSGANSGCGAGMEPTYVYSASSVASGIATSGTSVATSSFTLQPSTTYLLLVYTVTKNGDTISSIGSSGLTPSMTTGSFTAISSQAYSTGTNNQWAYWITTSSGASGSGTITVNLGVKIDTEAVVDVIQLGGTSSTAPIVTSNEAAANGSSTSATSALPNTPGTSDAGLVFLTSPNHLGPSAPTASPAMTNVFFASGYAGVYLVAPATSSSYAFPISGPGGGAWGTIGLDLTHP